MAASLKSTGIFEMRKQISVVSLFYYALQVNSFILYEKHCLSFLVFFTNLSFLNY